MGVSDCEFGAAELEKCSGAREPEVGVVGVVEEASGVLVELGDEGGDFVRCVLFVPGDGDLGVNPLRWVEGSVHGGKAEG